MKIHVLSVSLLLLFSVNLCLAYQKVSVSYVDNAQTEIVSPEGVRVLIDIFDPKALTSPATSNDILLTTHFHSDHFSQNFLDNFPGRKLTVQTGTIQFKDVEIIGIASAHNTGDAFADMNGTDYIYLIIIGGKMRIAHFGDIGQEALTPEQLKTLGNVDIAITQTANRFSNMTFQNLKGFNLMDQLKPKMVIPTHSSEDTIVYATKKWKTSYNNQTSVQINSDDLTGQTQFLILGMMSKYYGVTYELPLYTGK